MFKNKMFNRLLSCALALSMCMSLFACKKTTQTEEPTSGQSNLDAPKDITVNLHYLREDGEYEGWNVWFWTTGDGKAYQFNDTPDENGVVTTGVFPAGTAKVGFIVRLNEWEAKDIEEDQFIDTSSILAGTVDVYVESQSYDFRVVFSDDCVTGVGVSSSYIDSEFKTATIFITEYYTDDMKFTIVDRDRREVSLESLELDERNKKKLVATFKDKIDQFGPYYVCVNDSYYFDISIPDFYVTEAFENMYTYDGKDLGATYTGDSTTFKVWAPTATDVNVELFQSGDVKASDLIEKVAMTKGEKGTWSATVDRDLNGVYYLYEVTVDGTVSEGCDPYATAVGVNGDRAMVVDLAATNPQGWDEDENPNKGMNFTDASIYELHIRDLSSDASSGITNVGKFLGLTEKGTVNSAGIPTGLDHIVDLGVTHVQLNPVYDFATVDESKPDTAQYNWGYDPKNYNVPEGSYATDAEDGAVRINEFKQMVMALHENGLSVVMDVVYNHTYSTDFCFNKIVPGYFHRPNSNGSGCGNDVASERAMVRKYIVDSVVYWAKEYHIDGFRFDLVGLIDVETVKAIRAALDEIDPSIILYGEGWTMSTVPTKEYTYMANQNQIDKIDNFAMFNDTIRDSLKGSVFNATEKGYVNGAFSKKNAVLMSIMGKTAWTTTPYRLINYASCHDNLTLWDEINSSNAGDSLHDRISQNLLSASIVYTSQGIPFILAGEEFLRSKTNEDGSFNSNSYNAPDSVNSLKWDNLSDDDYMEVYKYYRGMIAFRKAHVTFRSMNSVVSDYTVDKEASDGVIAYSLKASPEDSVNEFYVIHNAEASDVTIELPEGEWSVYVYGRDAGTDVLDTVSTTITVPGISTAILAR